MTAIRPPAEAAEGDGEPQPAIFSALATACSMAPTM